jgi:L-alanine-DL-glutamate epimerase and related enzymes of enolase superfamily
MLTTAFERRTIPLADAFTISRGTRETAEVAVVRVTDDDGRTGVGAATPTTHYGETPATLEAVLPKLLAAVERVGDPHALGRTEREMEQTVRANPAARAAVSIAVHDLAAKRLDVSLYRLWGLDPERAPRTSFTVGIDDPDRMADRAAAAVERGHGVLKIKLGTDRDRERVAAVRAAAPDVRVRVDANEAWTPREAVRKAAWLADHGVEFVEQPVPADDPEGLRFVYENGVLPVAADESCRTLADVPRVADCADIANLKLMKCGGLREAKRMIAAARAHGLEVMLGCMLETSAGIAAACHLAPLLDYADLDGALLLADGADPYQAFDLSDGRIELTDDRPGTGARPR